MAIIPRVARGYHKALNAFGYLARATYSGYIPGRTRDLTNIAKHLDGSKELEITPEGIFIDHSQKVSTNPFLIEAFLEHQITKIETSEIEYKDLVKLSKGKSAKGVVENASSSIQEDYTTVKTRNDQKIMRLSALTALYGGIVYGSYKTLCFALTAGDMNTLSIICSSFLTASTILFTAINMLKQGFVANSTKYEPPQTTEEEKTKIRGLNGPKISILIPARNEPIEVLRKTLQAAVKINYTNYEIVLLLDSDPGSKNFQEVMELVETGFKDKVKIFARKKHKSITNQKLNKADNINAFINFGLGKNFAGAAYSPADYIVITDADYRLSPDFLLETVPLLERNQNSAYVMTPQNMPQNQGNPVEQANTALMNSSWQIVNRGVAHSARVLFGGCNSLIRLSALEDIKTTRKTGEVDYFPTDTVTEDLALTLRMMEKGYDSDFIPSPLAEGAPISSLGEHFSTFWRYTEGHVENTLQYTVPYIKSGKLSLFSIEGAEYLTKAINPIAMGALGIIALAPFSTLFGVRYPIASPIANIAYYLLLSNAAKAIFRTQKIKGSFEHAKATSLMFMHFPVFVSATYHAIKNQLLKKEAKFKVTNKDGTRTRVPLSYLLPLLGLFGINGYSLFEHISIFSYSYELWRLETAFWSAAPMLGIGYGLSYFNGIGNTLGDLYYGFKGLGVKIKNETMSTALRLGRLNWPA